MLGLVFGGYCTLHTDNEVGTAAAYFIGLFFSIVAITGGVPRLKIGDNELDPTSVALGAQVVAQAANETAAKADSPAEVAEAASEAAAELTPGPNSADLAGPTLRLLPLAVAYQQLASQRGSRWWEVPLAPTSDADKSGDDGG